jgi:hypothetical protein
VYIQTLPHITLEGDEDAARALIPQAKSLLQRTAFLAEHTEGVAALATNLPGGGRIETKVLNGQHMVRVIGRKSSGESSLTPFIIFVDEVGGANPDYDVFLDGAQLEGVLSYPTWGSSSGWRRSLVIYTWGGEADAKKAESLVLTRHGFVWYWGAWHDYAGSAPIAEADRLRYPNQSTPRPKPGQKTKLELKSKGNRGGTAQDLNIFLYGFTNGHFWNETEDSLQSATQIRALIEGGMHPNDVPYNMFVIHDGELQSNSGYGGDIDEVLVWPTKKRTQPVFYEMWAEAWGEPGVEWWDA